MVVWSATVPLCLMWLLPLGVKFHNFSLIFYPLSLCTMGRTLPQAVLIIILRDLYSVVQSIYTYSLKMTTPDRLDNVVCSLLDSHHYEQSSYENYSRTNSKLVQHRFLLLYEPSSTHILHQAPPIIFFLVFWLVAICSLQVVRDECLKRWVYVEKDDGGDQFLNGADLGCGYPSGKPSGLTCICTSPPPPSPPHSPPALTTLLLLFV